MAAASTCSALSFLQLQPYTPPAWTAGLKLVPTHRYRLGMLPTPLHRWHLPPSLLPEGVELWIKRDDLSGMQLSGNKVRKLEFLMAEAKQGGHDAVITIGGIQSNHARATAVAARYLGLPAHLVLRTSRAAVEGDPGLVGNLLVERLAGAEVHQVTKEEYARHGAAALGARLAAQLVRQGAAQRPYYIPVGGSSALGVWGYLQAVEELVGQAAALELAGGFDVIASACGSSATTAGLALGARLAGLVDTRVHAYCVCDDERYFYDEVDSLYQQLGFTAARAAETFTAVMAKGAGYALSREDELQTLRDVALASGVVLDPVYSGKAVHTLLAHMRADPAAWAGQRVLFVHTGGLLGCYDKLDQLQPLVGPGHRLEVAE